MGFSVVNLVVFSKVWRGYGYVFGVLFGVLFWRLLKSEELIGRLLKSEELILTGKIRCL